MAKQTREEYFKECETNKLPLPEIVRAGDVAYTDFAQNKVMVKDVDVNASDFREDDGKGNWGPWQKG